MRDFHSLKKRIVILLLLFCTNPVSAHLHNEVSYQQAWAKLHGAVCEYCNDDGTRVDCITNTHAIEFDFAKKWAEAIGQALYYQYKTGKKAMVILILECPSKEYVYLKHVQILGKIYNFDVDYVTPEILNIDKNGKCNNPKCKCKKI